MAIGLNSNNQVMLTNLCCNYEIHDQWNNTTYFTFIL